MIVQKAHEESGRERKHLRGIGRPDRRAHRHDVVLDERAAVTAAPEELAERQLAGLLVENRPGLAIETEDVADHAEERGSNEVAALREQRVERSAVVLEPSGLTADREAHAAFLRGDAELARAAP